MSLRDWSVTRSYQERPKGWKLWPIKGLAKPRMTRSDKWKKRPIVLKYRAYKDELRIFGVKLNVDAFYHVIFVIPHPKSWNDTKRHEHWFTPHQVTPDKDNLEKGLLDALFTNDAAAWDGRVTKVWGPAPLLIISTTNIDVSADNLRKVLGEAIGNPN